MQAADERNGSADDGTDRRIRRLEDAIAALSDTGMMEARVLERIVGQIQANQRALPAAGTSGPIPIEATERPGDPTALPMPTTSIPTNPIPGMFVPPKPIQWPSSWLLLEMARDLKTFCQLHFDGEYRVTRTTQLLVPLLIGLLFAGPYIFSALFVLPLLGTVLEKAYYVLVAILLYKQWLREAVRYRAYRSPNIGTYFTTQGPTG